MCLQSLFIFYYIKRIFLNYVNKFIDLKLILINHTKFLLDNSVNSHSFPNSARASESGCKSWLHRPDILDLHVAGAQGSGQRINGRGYYDAE